MFPTVRMSLTLACCAAAAALALPRSAAADGPQADDAVAAGRLLIAGQAEQVCRYAHAPGTYAYRGSAYLSHRQTPDGLHELTYRFTVKGNLKTQTMTLAFYFKSDGTFHGLRVPAYTTVYEPFRRLSPAYLRQLRKEMAQRPAVRDNPALRRRVDSADALQLCELHLQQARPVPKQGGDAGNPRVVAKDGAEPLSAKQPADWLRERAQLEARAKQHELRGDFDAARRTYQQALALEVRLSGKSHWRVTSLRLALASVEVLARLDVAQRRELAEAARWHQKAVTHYQAGQYLEAAALATKALALRKKILGDSHVDTALCLNDLGAFLRAQGDYAAARPCYEQALTIYKKELGDNHPDTATTLSNLGLLLHNQRAYAAAHPYLEQALAIRKKVLGDNHPATATSLANLGVLLDIQGDYAAARPCYEQALAIRKKVLGDNHLATATSLNNLGFLLHAQGDYATACPYLEQALAIRKKVLGDSHPDTATSLNNLGMLLQDQGDYGAARAYLEQALAICKKELGDNHPDTAQSLNNLGFLRHAQGEHAAARPYFEQALAIRKKVLGSNHSDTAQSLNNLGFLLHTQGEDAAARAYFEQALAIWKNVLGNNHPNTAMSLNNLGCLLQDQGDYAAARPYFEQALAICKKALGEGHPDTAMTLNNMGCTLHAHGESAAARPYLEQALAITQHSLDLAADAQSERQQLAMTGNLRYLLDNYLSLPAAARIKDVDAYAKILAWKGAVFVRQRQQRALRQAKADPELLTVFARFEGVSRRLANLVLGDTGQLAGRLKRLEELTREKEQLEQQLARRSRAFRKEKELAGLLPAQLQKLLPVDAALVDFLEYWHGEPQGKGKKWKYERRLVAFVLRPGRPLVRVELGAADPLAGAVDAWRGRLINARWIQEDAQAAALRRRVWEPLEKHLEGARLVLLAPDGPLTRLPFAALPGKKAGSFLLEERLLAVVPVPQWLPEVLAERKESGPPALLAVGGVDYEAAPGTPPDALASRSAARAGHGLSWPALQATLGETLVAQRLFQRRHRTGTVTVLDGDGATEAAFRREAPRHAWLHLATHGFFAPPALRSALALHDRDRARPGSAGLFERQAVSGYHPGLLSGLVLAGANRPPKAGADDGILTALEVAALDLGRAEMVVLSACETGLGATAGGEGLLGLQRAFQVAGARTVVATLWPVHDKGTAAFMGRFYENLWGQKRMGRLEALREAQLWLLREGREALRGLTLPWGPNRDDPRLPPTFWAGFVLSGDWR